MQATNPVSLSVDGETDLSGGGLARIIDPFLFKRIVYLSFIHSSLRRSQSAVTSIIGDLTPVARCTYRQLQIQGGASLQQEEGICLRGAVPRLPSVIPTRRRLFRDETIGRAPRARKVSPITALAYQRKQHPTLAVVGVVGL